MMEIRVKIRPFSSMLVGLMLTSAVHAGEIYSNRCTNMLINYLHHLQSEEKELEIMEFKFTHPPSEILAEQNLVIPPAKFHKNIKNFYRVPEIAKKGRGLFKRVVHTGSIPDSEFAKLLEKDTMYTFILQDDKITFAKTRSALEGAKPGVMQNYGSKHSILTDQSRPVKMAGEAWVDKEGVFHFDNNSGTFKPKKEHVENAEKFFHDHLGIQKVQGHMWTPPS
jgi:hypothetical protein